MKRLFMLNIFRIFNIFNDVLNWFINNIIIEKSDDIVVGFLITCFCYLLFSYIPEKRKKQKHKNYLNGKFLAFKKDMIFTLLEAASLNNNLNEVEKLLKIQEFRNFFSDKNNKNWDAVINGLCKDEKKHLINDIILLLEFFEQDLQYLLNNVDIKDNDVFSLTLNLKRTIFQYYRKRVNLEYDDLKSLMGFIYSIFSGWSFISGYSEKDVIEETINKI